MQNLFTNAKASLKATFRRPNSVIPEAQVAPMAQVVIGGGDVNSGATYTRRIVPVDAMPMAVAVAVPEINPRIKQLQKRIVAINKEITERMNLQMFMPEHTQSGRNFYEQQMMRLGDEREMLQEELSSLGVARVRHR